MENKSYYDAAITLFNNLSKEDAKKFITYASKVKSDIMEEISFSTLKDSTAIFGGVSKCINLMPLGIYVEGWFLPRNNYDVIEIYSNDQFLGNAELNIQRLDVYKNFSFYNEKNAGFSFLCSNVDLSKNPQRKISVVLKKNGIVVRKYERKLDGNSVEDELKKLQENIRENNNILLPTLTNRLPMILKIAQKMPNYNFVTLIEGMENNLVKVYEYCSKEYGINKQSLDILSMNMVPTVFYRNMCVCNYQVDLAAHEKELYDNSEFIRSASQNFATKYNTSLQYAIKYCCCAIEYAEQLIEQIEPQAVMIWNKYSPWHIMLENVAKAKGIPVIFMENGLLPGTLIFETEGQMGESYPAVYADEFLKLSVSDDDIVRAAEIVDKLCTNKLNRWISADSSVYVKSEKEVVLEKIKVGRPIILYAGQNDFESGMFPYTEKTKEFHSPIFESSEEAAIYLAKLAEKHNWNFIYKRHPMMRGKLIAQLPKNTIISDNIDIHDAIDLADLTITILSQTSYVAMIRNKPSLMLGFHQIKGKGCSYEVTCKEDIENTILEAITNGFTDIQKHNFYVHVAQLCKYYLYRDFTNNEIQYGKTLSDLVGYIGAVIENNVKEKNIEIKCSQQEMTVSIKRELSEEKVKSEFRLELSFAERLKRKSIKNQLMRCKEDELKKIIDYTDGENWYSKMMFIAQLGNEFLYDIAWDKKFTAYIRKMYMNGKEEFIAFMERVNSLNDVIKTNLNICNNFLNFFCEVLEENPDTYLNIVMDEEYQIYAKVLLKNLDNYYVLCEDEKRLQLIGKINLMLSEENISNKEKVYWLEWLWNKEAFTSDNVKAMNEILMTVTDENILMYYGVMELDRICFLKPECRYENYYVDRKRFIEYAAENLQGQDDLSNCSMDVSSENNKRIAILVTGLHGKQFASTRLQVGLANELSNRNYDVTIFVTDTNYVTEGIDFLVPPATLRRNFSKMIYKMDHCMMVESSVKIRYFIDDMGVKERYRAVINAIREYNPLVILDITNENAIYNPILRRTHKVITIPLNGYSSSSSFDAYIARNKELLEVDNEIFSSMQDIQCLKEANLYLPYDIESKSYERKNYGCKNNEFLVVTVGNRLDYEITEAVQKSMNEFLSKNPDIKWIIVGKITNKLQWLQNKIQTGQVKVWGYEKELSALYKMCDAYLDLPRSGGGGSVACAVQCGIPAVVIDMPSDILPFLGKENATVSWHDSLNSIKELFEDSEKRKRMAKEQYANLMSDKWNVENFVDVIEETIECIN